MQTHTRTHAHTHTNTHPHPHSYKIVRREVAVLIEKWADVCKFPAEQHAHVYSMLLSLQGTNEDLVVRLAANAALRAGVRRVLMV